MRAGVALGVVLAVVAVEAGAVELRALRVAERPTGATLSLELSAAAPVTVRDLRTGDRLYLDLPAGTRVVPAVSRVLSGAGPVIGVRIGARDDGAPRIVVELAPAATYEVARPSTAQQWRLDVAAAPPKPAPRTVALPPAVRDRIRPKIVLDPGHGGRDPGAHGWTVEKDVTLAIARRLATHLRERLGATTILTRTGDDTLSLADRTARANAEGADLFVSIHANAARNARLAGIETYYLNNTDDRATIRLAAMENGLDYVAQADGGTRLRYILSDLLQVGKLEESVGLARTIQRTLVGHLASRYGDITDLGIKRGPFYVLVGAHMPCVLVEASFLTHPVEGRRLATDAYQDAVAEGLYAGIAAFLADTRRARTL